MTCTIRQHKMKCKRDMGHSGPCALVPTFRNHHLFILFYPLPWSWTRPCVQKYEYGGWRVSFGFGQVEWLVD